MARCNFEFRTYFESKKFSQALDVLVKQMNVRDAVVVEAIFSQLKSSPVWRHRAEAGRLLISMGPDAVIGGGDHGTKQYDHVFEILENRLWDDPTRDVRTVIAHVVSAMGMVSKACERAEK